MRLLRKSSAVLCWVYCCSWLVACGDEAEDVDAAAMDAAVDMGGDSAGGSDAGARDTASVDVGTDAVATDTATDAAGDAGCGPVLARGQGQFSEPMGTVELKKADNTLFSTLNLDFGLGSAAFRDPKDSEGVFWAVTDRGPNYDCDTVYCTTTDNKIFAKPAFSPTIVKVTLNRAPEAACGLSVTVSNKLPILDKDGASVTGLPISPAYVKEEAVAPNQSIIPDNDNGMDTEGLVRLADGTFWLAEEYGPSLVHVDAAGKVVERVTPEGVKPAGAAAYNPNYPVTDGLPGLLTKRKSNRGFEALALSPDGKFLYTALQSPMQNPNKAAGDASLVIRIHKVSLKANGAFDKVEGEWLYLLDNEATFKLADNAAVKRTDLKVSEMVALGTDDLLVQERTDFVAKIYRVKLSTAAPLEAKWDAVATDPSLEKYDTANAAFAGVAAVAKVLVFDGVAYAAANQTPALPNKIEAITILGDYLVLVNDNDFNASQKTMVTLLPLPAAAK
ncbi:MAG: esterase-like activity of phytase family protein [Deltaproteobacteria bacterium]|nr:esterase-like activity of phytase family protein [Deltaproteobacteria bacterium]